MDKSSQSIKSKINIQYSLWLVNVHSGTTVYVYIVTLWMCVKYQQITFYKLHRNELKET